MDSSSLIFKALEFYGTRLHHRGQWRIHSALRGLLRADIDCELTVERAGLRYELNPCDYVRQDLFWLGEYDRWIVWHVEQMVERGSVIVDAGANFGYYSLRLAAHLSRECRVFAVEPHPITRARLERNIALNQMESVISVFPFGLSDRAETGFITQIPPENTGTAYCSLDESAGHPIELITLDDMADLYQLSKLNFLKVDVEGYEERLIRGARSTLKRFRPTILIEFMRPNLERAGSSAQELADLLRSYNYKLFTMKRKRLIPLTELPQSSVLLNVFCLPD